MKIILTNMCMIHNLETNKVLVLDKIKKEGWEGLTFPGGHVEKIESLTDSCVREIKEETNLCINNLELKGSIQWYNLDNDERILGLLYYTNTFSGKLIENNKEGRLSWENLDEFIEMKDKSNSMDDIMKIYMGKYKEVIGYYRESELVNIEYKK
ncbi:8-oxo-dGTP diphosphatase [Miniphocaeibacter massiliensis]|uniref:8-oxo-dGTP diphosphatase n=1 Tax=Miniphocaeibacter massiliensis TaxID=2041841 RepID=UPI000C1C7CAD|nr:NUDIX domain-containing protein [Miniphocaeibacter massiliensis]